MSSALDSWSAEAARRRSSGSGLDSWSAEAARRSSGSTFCSG